MMVDFQTGVSQDVTPVLPTTRSLAYTSVLYALGNLFLYGLAPHLFIYFFVINLALSLLVLYVRLRPLLALGHVAGNVAMHDVEPSEPSRARLILALGFLGAVVPLLLVYVLPFEYWVSMIYLFISSWPLANWEFYGVLRFTSHRFGVSFYRVQRFKDLAGERYLVSSGYMVMNNQASQ